MTNAAVTGSVVARAARPSRASVASRLALHRLRWHHVRRSPGQRLTRQVHPPRSLVRVERTPVVQQRERVGAARADLDPDEAEPVQQPQPEQHRFSCDAVAPKIRVAHARTGAVTGRLNHAEQPPRSLSTPHRPPTPASPNDHPPSPPPENGTDRQDLFHSVVLLVNDQPAPHSRTHRSWRSCCREPFGMAKCFFTDE